MSTTEQRTWHAIRHHAETANSEVLRDTLLAALGKARRPRPMTMRHFAETRFVLPTGDYANQHYNCARAPWAGLFLDEVDSGRWRKIFMTGPSQSGKTTVGFMIPSLYTGFELRETWICGVPDGQTADDKWRQVLLPAILADEQFRKYLPTSGRGSKGGFGDLIEFTNGASMRTMTGQGSDASRANFTARTVIVTETDSVARVSESSQEADPLKQLQARSKFFDTRAVFIAECTVTTADGATWRELKNGSDSRIVTPCPHCQAWVTPEREHLKGWEAAADAMAARETGRFHCPECDAPFTEQERSRANARCRLLHKGQTIDRAGTVHGDLPRTDTLGFRYTAWHNLFVSMGSLAVSLWQANDAAINGTPAAADSCEKSVCQFDFAIPYEPSGAVSDQLESTELLARAAGFPRGTVPENPTAVVAHIDVHKRHLTWMVMAFTADARGRIVDYGDLPIDSDAMGFEQALHVGGRQILERFDQGYIEADSTRRFPPRQVWIDAGWETEAVYQFCKEFNGAKRQAEWRVRPALGRGAAQAYRMQRYSHPQKVSGGVRYIGEEYHVNQIDRKGGSGRRWSLWVVLVNVDHWKDQAYARLSLDPGKRGAIALPNALLDDHSVLIDQLTSERRVQRQVRNRLGQVERMVVWTNERRAANHYFDNVCHCVALGHLCGVRMVPETEAAGPPPAAPAVRVHTPDGRPFVARR